MPPRTRTVDRRALRRWALPDPGASKYDRGTVLVVGGALSSPGAVSLAGVAALRVGAGRITLAVARSVAPALGVGVPEAGVVALPETTEGSVRPDAYEAVLPVLSSAQAVLIGPGLDDVDSAARLVEALAAEARENTAFVLDAYALGAVAKRPGLVDPLRGRLVMTPSPTELGVLLGEDDVPPDRPGAMRRAAREVARRYAAAVATQALVAEADGATWRFREGGPGLGTSGSGDVLAGAVAGFAARGTGPVGAAVWGTHVHAAADRLLAPVRGGVGYLAREIPDRFPGLIASSS
ncbi:ADP-dependent NAD(P)H-hydrate dehydratase [Microbacterium marinilacus]|uniref:ADP-dependent (S)-NAD(P)H-hydrate dehydratase n=1 Tax=Microbacterium marinilacus TaxID=415209 RepID=A0ABP7BJB5_9MICO|nr:ADP/ATP-dependent (S)-NAD(P)H-hydrate dehydratase [Microbacterium marinilacus]MBY0687703.1 NAD(P)H-hydrate dehydratase [Microbacterium marinilacus]